MACGAALVLALSATGCGFPEYDFREPAVNGGAAGLITAGAPGLSGSNPGGGGSGSGGSGGNSGMQGGSGGPDAGSAGDGDAGAAGAPNVPVCPFLDPVRYPDHCFDDKQSDGESALNCGGGECSACSGTQTCVKNGDCLSGRCAVGNTCAQTVILSYMSLDSNAMTVTPHFKLVVQYQDTTSVQLKDLRIRYYFRHNGVIEPLIAFDTQAFLSGTEITGKGSWLVHRYPLGPADHNGRQTDSYLEISFSSAATLSAGSKLELTQGLMPGNSDVAFDQTSNYSFLNGSAANEAITVYRGSQRVWGVEPPMNLFPACAFVKGVNLGGGAALVIDGEAIAQEGDQDLSFSTGQTYTDSAAKALPATDTATTSLLTTAHTFGNTDTASWPVPNGKYWAYAWLTAANGMATGTLSIQDNPFDKFVGAQKSGAAEWALVGPYPIDVTEAKVTLSASGTVNVAGLKLYQVDH